MRNNQAVQAGAQPNRPQPQTAPDTGPPQGAPDDEQMELFSKARNTAAKMALSEKQAKRLADSITPQNAPNRLSPAVVQVVEATDREIGPLPPEILLAVGMNVIADLVEILPIEISGDQILATNQMTVNKWLKMHPEDLSEEDAQLAQQVAGGGGGQQGQPQQAPQGRQPPGLLGGV